MSESTALYVHWPFCVAKCPYCDFNSHVATAVDQTAWARDFVSDMRYWRDTAGPRRIGSVFFGGGTPSLMDPSTVATILENTHDFWGMDDDVEVTLEANPSSVEAGRFRDYRAAGVNRISVGVQALDDASLHALGRVHDARAGRDAVAAASRTFERFSFDLIYARPGQTVADWRRELSEALSMAGEHLSLYQLTIEPGTAFFRDRVASADEDLAVALYDVTQEMTEAAGLSAYEISNHARPGGESRHNLTYWRGGEYVGVGPGAHGRLRLADGWAAAHEIATPERWRAAVGGAGHGVAKMTRLSAAERAEETVMTGLRLTTGLDAHGLAETLSVIDEDGLKLLVENGFLIHDRQGLRTTPAGRLRLNAVVERLLGGA